MTSENVQNSSRTTSRKASGFIAKFWTFYGIFSVVYKSVNISESNIRRFGIAGCHCQVKCLALVVAYKYVYNYADKVSSS